jgi:hypothetical protein
MRPKFSPSRQVTRRSDLLHEAIHLIEPLQAWRNIA